MILLAKNQKPAAREGGHELLQPKGRLCADAHAVGLVSDARANCTLHHTQGGCGSLLAEELHSALANTPTHCNNAFTATPCRWTKGTGARQHTTSCEAANGLWDCCAHLFISTSADLDL